MWFSRNPSPSPTFDENPCRFLIKIRKRLKNTYVFLQNRSPSVTLVSFLMKILVVFGRKKNKASIPFCLRRRNEQKTLEKCANERSGEGSERRTRRGAYFESANKQAKKHWKNVEMSTEGGRQWEKREGQGDPWTLKIALGHFEAQRGRRGDGEHQEISKKHWKSVSSEAQRRARRTIRMPRGQRHLHTELLFSNFEENPWGFLILFTRRRPDGSRIVAFPLVL